jgi:hypothetical protein
MGQVAANLVGQPKRCRWVLTMIRVSVAWWHWRGGVGQEMVLLSLILWVGHGGLSSAGAWQSVKPDSVL